MKDETRELEFLKRLDGCEGAIHELLSPPFEIEEVSLVLRKIAEVMDEFAPAPTLEGRKQLFVAAWDWLKRRFDVLAVLDRMIELPQPWEALDRMAIDLIARQLVVPLLAGATGKKG